jgi:hypothetical protein
MNHGNIFSASDRSIFDALMQSKVIKDALQELFLRRGIIISRDTPRKDIALYFSRVQHDYKDYMLLSTLLGSISGKEHLGTKYLRNTISISELSTIATCLGDITEELDVKTFDANIVGTSLKLNVNYTLIHFSKSEFRQVVEKDAVIEIEQDNNGVKIRYPVNKKSELILNSLFEKVEAYLDEAVDIDEISLANVLGTEKRKVFFEMLMDGMPGYEMIDVVDAYVYNPLSADDGDSDDGNGKTETRISKAALKGMNVLDSNELKEFLKNGFFVTKVVWVSRKSEDEGSDLYEFEAQFKKPEIMGDFNYIVRGHYKAKDRQEDGLTAHSNSRSSLATFEETRLNRLIEQAALVSMRAVCKPVGSISDAKDEVVKC